MPFTLAHPAAILPFRRYCPRYLSLAGLVVGSVAPDVGYFFQRYKLDELSHSFAGSFLFCLPVGMAMLLIIYGLRGWVVSLLPERHQRLFLPLCRQPAAAPLILVISILIGAWTHQIWDNLTHPHGWLTAQFPVLHTPIGTVRGHTVEICHLLLYVSSFAGVALICAAYGKWRDAASPSAPPVSRAANWRNALLVAALAMPIEAVHHLYNTLAGLVIVGVFCLLLMAAVALKFGDAMPRPS